MVVSRPGAIAGSITIPPLLRRHFEMHLDCDEQEFHTRRFHLNNGPFEVQALIPGLYTVVIKAGGDEIERFEGIVVRSGETARPTCLEALTLGEGFRLETVRVVNPEGEPMRDVSISTRLGPPTGQRLVSRGTVTDDRGEATILVAEHLDLSIRIESTLNWERHWPRFAVEYLENPEFPLTVRLGWEPQVTLTLNRPLPPAPPEGWALMLSRPLDPHERAHSERLAEEQRRNERLPSDLRASARAQTHRNCRGESMGGDPAALPTYRFNHALRAGRYELRLGLARTSPDVLVVPVTLGQVDITHGEQALHWTLTQDQVARIQTAFEK